MIAQYQKVNEILRAPGTSTMLMRRKTVSLAASANPLVHCHRARSSVPSSVRRAQHAAAPVAAATLGAAPALDGPIEHAVKTQHVIKHIFSNEC